MNHEAIKDNPAVGRSWEEVRAELFTPEEIAKSNLRVELIGERQPIIARMEKGSTSPQLETILKVLAPLGKTLAVVPLESK